MYFIMSETILAVLLVLFTFVAYFCWIRPRKMMRQYVRNLEKLGYKALQLPYHPFKNYMFAAIKQGIAKGDAMLLFKQKFNQYDVVVGNVLTKPSLQLNHPDFHRQFYAVDKHYQFPKEKKIVDIFSRVAGHGLPFSEGENWKRKRKILNKIFNFDFVKSQSIKISAICEDSINQLEKDAKKDPLENSVTYSILDLTVKMFSQVMMESFLGGTKEEMISNEPAGIFLKRLISNLTQQSFYPLNFILGTKFLSLGITKQQREIQSRVQIYRKWGLQFIRKRIAQINHNFEANKDKNRHKEPSDILQAFILADKTIKNENNSNQENIISEEEIFEQFNAFFVAGTDTTSNFVQTMIYAIAIHPEVEAKVRQQIEKFMSTDDYSYDNLKNLTYIQLLEKETTRYYGPGTHLFSRNAKQDNYLNGLPIRKGTSVTIMTFGNNFCESYFKNPQEFRPERWQKECNDIPPFAYGGFSAGARTCIGKHLALMESKIALVKILKRYKKIILPDNNFKMTFKFLYSPEDFDTKLVIDQKK